MRAGRRRAGGSLGRARAGSGPPRPRGLRRWLVSAGPGRPTRWGIGAQPLNDNMSRRYRTIPSNSTHKITRKIETDTMLLWQGFRWCRIQTMNGIYAFAARVPVESMPFRQGFHWCRIQRFKTMNGIYAFAARVPWIRRGIYAFAARVPLM